MRRQAYSTRSGWKMRPRPCSASIVDCGRLAAEHRGVYILDYDALVARHGRESWGDARKWLTVRLPVASANLPHLAAEWLRFLHPLTGRVAKCVAVDLDNTLWGGVIGEDGMTGIRLGTEYPGAAFQELQRALLDLSRRGILLAICSKNNPADAMEALVHASGDDPAAPRFCRHADQLE